MVDAHIYRAALALLAVGVIVFGFSLESQPGPEPTNLATSVATGNSPYRQMLSLAARYPHRTPGSPADMALASDVTSQLRAIHGYAVSVSTAVARTAAGLRPIETVTATRTGLTSGAVVVLSHRDAAGSPGVADLSGTTVLLDLARLLAGETENRTLILVSTSGSVGAAGAAQVAASLAGQPVDAVIVLGDLTAAHPTRPLVVPWSNTNLLAPPLLRQTVGRYLGAALSLNPGGASLPGQLAHLAFPLTITEQGPFARQGLPAVLVSLSGVRLPSAGEPVSAARMRAAENGLLQTLNALDNGPAVPPPAAYLELSGKLVPAWAVRLLVLALILPVGLATLDAVARARRRGHSILRWLGWSLAGAAPFGLALAILLVVGFAHLLPATPPGPVAGGVAIGSGGIALLVVVALALVFGFALLRPALSRRAVVRGTIVRVPNNPVGDAAPVSVLVLLTLSALVLWLGNPFAAALLVPALHLWLWLAQPGFRQRRALAGVAWLLGLVPAVLIVVYYAHSFGLSPLGLAWTGTLRVLGGQLSIPTSVVWCVTAGCAASALVIVLRARPERDPTAEAVTVRGPVTYAGPGSLGGTESALGSRR